MRSAAETGVAGQPNDLAGFDPVTHLGFVAILFKMSVNSDRAVVMLYENAICSVLKFAIRSAFVGIVLGFDPQSFTGCIHGCSLGHLPVDGIFIRAAQM